MTDVRQLAYEHARTYLGVHEEPPGSNRGPLIDKWLRAAGVQPPAPWCMAFVHSMYLPFGVDLGGWASVGNFLAWAMQHGEIVGRPRRYDIVCFDWNSDGWADHVGIVERVLSLRWTGSRFVGWIQTIEGNSSDMVKRNRRWVNAATRFVRIPG